MDSDVLQGSVLGPLLFSIYINDLPNAISNGSTARFFADDCVLYKKIQSHKDTLDLQADLNLLQDWEKSWKMEFHPGKCQVIKVTNKKNIIKGKYTIHGELLESVDSAKYLGVTIHRKLTWNTHITNTVNKANKTLAFIRRNTHQCPKTIKEQCYKTLVRPILEYGSVVWDPHTKQDSDMIEAIQRRAARYVTGDYRWRSSPTAMLDQLKWPPLKQRRAQAKVIMIFRIRRKLVEIPSTSLIPAETAGRTRGHDQKLQTPYNRTNVMLYSFFPDAIRLWNSLDQKAVDCKTIDSFKKLVQEHN